MLDLARIFRKNATSSEAALWNALRNRRLAGRRFRRQQPVGSFVVDFFCPEERLIVEVDGPIHEDQPQADRERQHLLEALGLHVLRVSSEDAENNLELVLQTIRECFNPSPFMGEGKG